MEYEKYKAIYNYILQEIIKNTEKESDKNASEISIYGFFCFDASLYRVNVPDEEKLDIRNRIYNYMKEELIIEDLSDEKIQEKIIQYAKIQSEYKDSESGPYFMLGQKFLENIGEEKKLEKIINIGSQLHYAYNGICNLLAKEKENRVNSANPKSIEVENTKSGTKLTYKDKYYVHFAWKPFLIIVGIMVAVIFLFAK